MREKLILFDIDLTLVDPRGAGREAMERAFVDVFGTAGPIAGYQMAGKIDSQIARELMASAGVSSVEVEAKLPDLWKAYLTELEAIVATGRVRVLPGVPALLERLAARPDVLLGLLTGNVQAAAWLKLRAVGLDGFFRLGAFGDDAAARGELPAIAVARAHELIGRQFDGAELVVIGDTPLDIACGQAAAARTVGVATGPYSVAELRQAGADAALEDLSETEKAVEAILGKRGN